MKTHISLLEIASQLSAPSECLTQIKLMYSEGALKMRPLFRMLPCLLPPYSIIEGILLVLTIFRGSDFPMQCSQLEKRSRAWLITSASGKSSIGQRWALFRVLTSHNGCLWKFRGLPHSSSGKENASSWYRGPRLQLIFFRSSRRTVSSHSFAFLFKNGCRST